MNSVFKKLAFVAALAVSVVAQDDLVVNTPLNVVVCRPIQITFSGGEPPYFLTIRPGNQPTGGETIVDFGELQTDDAVRWVANQPVGTSLGLDLRDSTGRVAQTAPFTILSGSDTSCVGQDPSSSAAPSSTGSSPAGSSSASSGAPSSSAPSSSAPATSSSARPTTSAPTVSRSSPAPGVSVSRSSTAPGASQSAEEDSAASSNYASAALAGLAGAAAVLLA